LFDSEPLSAHAALGIGQIFYSTTSADITGPTFFLHESELARSVGHSDEIQITTVNGKVSVFALDKDCQHLAPGRIRDDQYFYRFDVPKGTTKLDVGGAEGECFCGLPNSLHFAGMQPCQPHDGQRCTHSMHQECARLLQSGYTDGQIRSGVRRRDSSAWISQRMKSTPKKQPPSGSPFRGSYMCPGCASRCQMLRDCNMLPSDAGLSAKRKARSKLASGASASAPASGSGSASGSGHVPWHQHQSPPPPPGLTVSAAPSDVDRKAGASAVSGGTTDKSKAIGAVFAHPSGSSSGSSSGSVEADVLAPAKSR